MGVLELVKAMFNDTNMSDDDADIILWGCTGYPSFFNGNPVRCLCYQLRHASRALKRGFTIDDIYSGNDKINATTGDRGEE